MIDFLQTRRLKYFLRLEYPMQVVFTLDGVRGAYPDLPGCEIDAPSLAHLHQALHECRRTWIHDRLRQGRSVPLPNCHLSSPPAAARARAS